MRTKHQEMKSWLKTWGSFTDEEVETYPYSMVDVMAIMQEYAGELTKAHADLLERISRQEDVIKSLKEANKFAVDEAREMQFLIKCVEPLVSKFPALWAEHQRTKFLSDGSHFQVDKKLDEFAEDIRKFSEGACST